MPVEFTYVCALPSGLHARPCSRIAELAAGFGATAQLTNTRNQRSADLRSVLSLLSADVLLHDACRIAIAGPDESAAAKALRDYLENVMPGQEEAAPPTAESRGKLPRALRLANTPAIFGQSLSAGFGQGALLVAAGLRLPEPTSEAAPDAIDETEKLERALRQVREALPARTGSTETAIAEAHRAILADSAFRLRLLDFIRQGSGAVNAVLATAHSFAEELQRSKSAYIRERGIDIEEVSLRLYQALGGKSARGTSAIALDAPTILFAERLGAQELLQCDRALLRGIIFAEGQTTSHAVILARSLGIPAIAADSGPDFVPGEPVIVDGTRGYAVAATEEAVRFYEREREWAGRRRESLERFAHEIVSPLDGNPIEVAANVSSPEEAEAGFAAGCDGIGLFRTEMLFVGRAVPPTEDEQFAAYARAVRAAEGKPVILRTFDVGGDKPAPFLQSLAHGPLGDRGLLVYKEHPALIQAQLRAMLRASTLGTLRIMVPLVATAADLRWVRAQLESAKAQLRGTAFDPDVQLGAMLELPEAVANLDALAQEADFFSIGTNDLAQYFFRVDRTATKLNLMSAVRRPEFLRLLADIAAKARAGKKWLGMCGEMAGDSRNLPLLVGMGLDELSLAGREALRMKQRITQLDRESCEPLLQEALQAADQSQVEALLDRFIASTEPLLTQELIEPASSAASREEAIRELADLLALHDRAVSADELEEALWDREATYPTDMGLGFALPHCKSDAVAHSSIAVLRPEEPFLWSPESTVPVRAVIMLAMKNESGAHMQVLSKLARRLMDEEFREQLLSFTQPAQAVQLLSSQVGISQEASR